MPTPETSHQRLRITFIFPPHGAVRTVRLILSHITFFVSFRLMSQSSALALQVSHLFEVDVPIRPPWPCRCHIYDSLSLMSQSVHVNVGSGEWQNGGLHKTHFPHYAFANIANFLINRTRFLLQRVSKRPDEPPLQVTASERPMWTASSAVTSALLSA